MSLWEKIKQFRSRHRDPDDEAMQQAVDDSDCEGEIHLSEEEEPEDRAKTIDKRKIFAAAGIVTGIAVVAVITNQLMTPKAKEDTLQNHGIASASTPADQLPEKYSDIDKKKKKQTEKPDASKATQTTAKERPGTDTREPLPAKATVSSRTTSAATPAPAARQAAAPATVETTTSSTNTVREDPAEKEEEQAYDSAIAFKIAVAISKEQSDSVLQPLGNAQQSERSEYLPVSTQTADLPIYQDDFEEDLEARYVSSNIRGSYILNAGAVIQATLLTGITSDVPNGDVVAQVRQDIYDSLTGMHLLIPQGSRLLGRSGNAKGFGNERIGVQFYRIILPDGTSLTLPEQQAIDGTGYPGLKDKYSDHSGRLFRTAFLSSIFAAAAQSATGHSSGSDDRSPGQEAVAGAVASILNTGNTLVQSDAGIGPTIEIEPGFQFSVFVNQDLLVGEYHGV